MKKSQLTLKHTGIISAVIFAVLFALRLYQMIKITDPETGFFTDHSDITVIPMYVLAIGSVIAVTVLCYLSKDKPAGKRSADKDYFHAAASLLFAVSLAVSAWRDFSSLTALKDSSVDFGTALKLSGGYTQLLIPVFALLSVFVFIADFVSAATGKNYMEKLRIPMLFPVFWAFFLTVNHFTVIASYLKVAQLMLTIFSTGFMTLFLFEYARMNSGIGRKDAVWAFYATGIITAGLNFVSSLPTLIFTFADPGKIIVHCPLKLYYLAAVLFSVSAMINFSKTKEIAASEKTEIE